MRRPRGLALACAVVVFALAVGGATALVLVRGEHGDATPTTGPWSPITVSRPNVPVIGGGVPVDLDPLVRRDDFSTTLAPLPGTNRYGITIANISNLGAINAFQWYPPVGVHITRLIGSTQGRCVLTGLKGFGGNQFPTLVLYPNVFCKALDLKAPSCTCLGDGGAVTISFVTDKAYPGGTGDLRMRAATLVFDRIPSYLKPGATPRSPG